MMDIGGAMDDCQSCERFEHVTAVATRNPRETSWTTRLRLCDECLSSLKSKLCVGMVPEQAHARRTDPDTSKLAARSVNVTKGQELTLALIRRAFPCDVFTLDALVAAAEKYLEPGTWTPSGMRSRCMELVTKGKVLRLGTTRLPSGRQARLHRLVTT